MNAVNDSGLQSTPGGALSARANLYKANPAGNTLVNMSANMITAVGGSQPHNNLQPYLTLHFCIALQGVFPPRT